MTEGVVNVRGALYDGRSREEGASPAKLRTSESLEFWERVAEDVGRGVAGRETSDTRARTPVLDHGDLRLVAALRTVDELVDEE